MSPEALTALIAACAGVLVVSTFAWLVLIPAWASYSRVWERVAATFLSLYVLLTFVGIGVGAGLGIAWFWDRIQG